MNGEAQAPDSFRLRDCALVAIATGRRAQNLRELRDILSDVHPGCIYYHFWGGLLRPRFQDREFNNDFASWARHGLHDAILAERLSVVDPTELVEMEDLRQELIDIIEERLDEHEHVPWAKADQQFEFIRSQIIIFNTELHLGRPEELATVVPNMSASSIFYHYIDARRRTEGGYDDFRAWLGGFSPKYDTLCAQLASIDPYFESLTELRRQLSDLFQNYFGGQSS
jgi:hypothetical protein